MTHNLSTRQGFKHVLIIAGLMFALPWSNIALSAAVVKPVSKTVYKMPLNDTGITRCSRNAKRNLPCPVADFPGQDAQYGRDKTNNNVDGYAGFSFTKISNTGKALPDSALHWNCVKDNVTRLMWEGKTDDGGLHDMDWTYGWYNPDSKTNAGDSGSNLSGNFAKCMTGLTCNTDTYIKAVNKVGWCGHKDWRLPTRMELINLLSLNRVEPALNKKYFPEANINAVWSSSLNPYSSRGFSGGVWYIDFSDGSADWASKYISFQVRLVRGR